MERKCGNCYYSQPSLNKELVVCSYMNDIIKSESKDLENQADLRTIKYFTSLSNFSGDAFLAYSGEKDENDAYVKKLCVAKDSRCGKFKNKRS